jgi:cytochrome c-type biogenesis protein CcmH
MMLWIFFAALIGVTLTWIGWPLLQPAPAREGRDAFDAVVYLDQLEELERDRARGLVDESQLEAARTEIERRLLAASRAEGIEANVKRAGPSHTRSHIILAVLVLLAVPAITVPLYFDLGSPHLPNLPFAERTPVAPPSIGIAAQAQARLAAAEERANNAPDDPQGWFDLGRFRLVSGDFDGAVEALARAMETSNNRADIASAYGEALSRQADGRVTAEARNAFTIARASNPGDPRARYFLALSDYQEGREEAALRAWSDLGRSAPEGAPWLPAVQARIVETARELGEAPTDWLPPPAPDTPRGPFAGGGPTGADIAAAQEMSPEDRQEMIRGMVANLAARLEDDPDDVEGWRRLARSREVLGDNEASSEAYDRALELDPDHPETLLRSALSAAQIGENAKARARFVRLRDIVPADSEVYEMVSEAISRLDQGGDATAQ